jgi:putative Ca2+/H+ antiporter (TMEM165/GDT1 family)
MEKLLLLFSTYAVVLTAELIGDKSIYTIATLVSRYRAPAVLLGVVAASMAKMGAAVMLGAVISSLPRLLISGLSALSFFLMGILFWFGNAEEQGGDQEVHPRGARGAMVAFCGIFFTEWGDPGQISAATMAAQHLAPWVVWTGATLALTTKGVLASVLGVKLYRRIPVTWLRYAGAAVCLTMGLSSLIYS